MTSNLVSKLYLKKFVPRTEYGISVSQYNSFAVWAWPRAVAGLRLFHFRQLFYKVGDTRQNMTQLT